ncbi:MAG: biopolymer transporter ExbD [Ignavibacteriales bacterium]|nr:biopolymer transporter ExbD [Ignavibacteriota bacterium]MCB0748192.1 biopolymer transporter ExbD [Ignavibacteriota bacterium]MCB9250074.1 biopolymer transporter ExbD [Ignavibacteriales bacterium]
MAAIKRKQREGGSFSASSMADITFLLLLFFLVTTNIDVDTGIGLVLPEYVPPEERVDVPISKERLVNILVNENGDVLLNGDVIAIPQIKDRLKERIKSKIDLPKNKKLIVSIKTDKETNYNIFIQTLDQVELAFAETREEYSLAKYGKKVKDLNDTEADEMKENVYKVVSFAEPEVVK